MTVLPVHMFFSLGVVPSLFALSIAHWFISLSTLARCDEPSLHLALRMFIPHCYLARCHFSVLCAMLMSPQRTKQYIPLTVKYTNEVYKQLQSNSTTVKGSKHWLGKPDMLDMNTSFQITFFPPSNMPSPSLTLADE